MAPASAVAGGTWQNYAVRGGSGARPPRCTEAPARESSHRPCGRILSMLFSVHWSLDGGSTDRDGLNPLDRRADRRCSRVGQSLRGGGMRAAPIAARPRRGSSSPVCCSVVNRATDVSFDNRADGVRQSPPAGLRFLDHRQARPALFAVDAPGCALAFFATIAR